MFADRACVGEEPIQRYDRRDPGEDGEKREECHAAGGGQDPIFRDRPEHPPKDIPPPARRDLLRRVCFAPAARFTGTREIDRAARITPRPNLSAPVISFVGCLRGGDALTLHGQDLRDFPDRGPTEAGAHCSGGGTPQSPPRPNTAACSALRGRPPSTSWRFPTITPGWMRGVMLSGVRLFQIEPLRVRGVLQCMRERHLTVEAALAGSVQELN